MPHPPIRKAVFPVAGLGTRFLPATKATRKGFERGIEQGLEQGKAESKIDIARAMLAEGLAPQLVAKLTGLSTADIDKLPNA